jgi:hypothetical protein
MLVASVAIGAGATLVMDGWNLFLKRALGIPSLDYCLLGRWVSHFREGTFRHTAIGAAARKPGECAIGWLTHYTIGVALAFGFVLLVSNGWIGRPTVLPALAYGIATVVFPFLVLQPAFGLGIAASRAPRPARARAKSLITHSVFGIGLWVSAIGSGFVTQLFL